jgi:hypothetical protein
MGKLSYAEKIEKLDELLDDIGVEGLLEKIADEGEYEKGQLELPMSFITRVRKNDAYGYRVHIIKRGYAREGIRTPITRDICDFVIVKRDNHFSLEEISYDRGPCFPVSVQKGIEDTEIKAKRRLYDMARKYEANKLKCS